LAVVETEAAALVEAIGKLAEVMEMPEEVMAKIIVEAMAVKTAQLTVTEQTENQVILKVFQTANPAARQEEKDADNINPSRPILAREK